MSIGTNLYSLFIFETKNCQSEISWLKAKTKWTSTKPKPEPTSNTMCWKRVPSSSPKDEYRIVSDKLDSYTKRANFTH